MSKILTILGSVRFQQLAVAIILLILAFYKVIPQELANLLAGLFGVSITIGTVDKVADKIAGK
jgi:hypothetical protein